MSSHQSEQIGHMSSHQSEASGTNISNDDHSFGTPTRRSKVWEHFESELVEVDGAMKAVCRYCGMRMATGKSAHYVDANFVLHKKIISFKAVKYPHSGVAIEEAMTKCMTEYGIKEKIFTITLDNAVPDGLTIADATIEMTRDLIRHINSSPKRIQAFNEIAEREGLPRKAGLVLDVPNRWNSTHARIIEAVKYKIVLKRYAASNQELFPSDDEWTEIEAIGEYLGAFEEATRAFSADRFPTAHIFLDKVLCIHQALKNPAWQTNQIIQNLAIAMGDKFSKYWEGNYNMALVIATILDPRNKLDFLEFFYQRVCKYFVDVDVSISIAREWMTKYFRKYEEIVRRNGADPVFHTTVSRGNVGSPVLGKRRMHQEFAQFRTQKRAIRIEKSELDAYLEDEHVRDDENFEILSWWKTNQNKYPVLSAMARDFLAIPLSTVSSESAFSLSGRILGDNRSSMTAETLEALVCVKDWLYKLPDNEDHSLFVVSIINNDRQ